jgi:hypothetical protein
MRSLMRFLWLVATFSTLFCGRAGSGPSMDSPDITQVEPVRVRLIQCIRLSALERTIRQHRGKIVLMHVWFNL